MRWRNKRHKQQVVKYGATFDEAKRQCEELARVHGYRYIHSGDEPLLIAGVGIEALEMLEEQPDLDLLFVPIGGGSGAAGVGIAAHVINPSIQVIGVQAEASPCGL